MVQTLFDSIRKVYKIKVKCTNCQEITEVSVQKGVTFDEGIKNQSIKCPNCGTTKLERYMKK